MRKQLLLHPFAFAIFPVLALLANNITEVSPRVAVRSIVISLVVTLLLFLAFRLASRSWEKAALCNSLFLVLFFSYGNLYELLQKYPLFGFSLGRHRYLAILYLAIMVFGCWVILYRLKELVHINRVLNIVGICLLIFPTYQVISHTVRSSISERRISQAQPQKNAIPSGQEGSRPDVYFIVLDGYMRADALKQDIGLDNSAFVQSLRNLGFYVVDCSRSNYVSTHASLVSALNMEYLPTLQQELAAQGLTSSEDLWLLIKQSKLRSMLESAGYKTVSFETGFDWSRLLDADVYLKHTGTPYEMQVMQPFEAMLIRNTLLLIWSDATYKSLPDYKHTFFGATNFPFEFHINQQLFIFDQLPRLASFPGPKFVFAHILTTHYPFVFRADGEILTDPGYYSELGHTPVDDQHAVDGYTNAIQFTNSRMVGVLDSLVTRSEDPPIIVVMGDHGLSQDNRLANLLAVYLPAGGEAALYPTITPVNVFRVISDTYFGTSYGLLPDQSYNGNGVLTPDPYPACIQK